eukprot:8802058-Karenia_brevis.AAC.1
MQMRGDWQVNTTSLQRAHEELRNKLRGWPVPVAWQHIEASANWQADELANMGLSRRPDNSVWGDAAAALVAELNQAASEERHRQSCSDQVQHPRRCPSAAALRRALLQAPPPPPPELPQDALIAGALRCPLCNEGGRAYASVPPLMRHVTISHAGETLSVETAEFLNRLGRATCTAVGCGGFRRLGQRACNRCNRSTPARAPQAGDVIAGPAIGEQACSSTAVDASMADTVLLGSDN